MTDDLGRVASQPGSHATHGAGQAVSALPGFDPSRMDPDGWLAVKVNGEGGIVMPYGPLHPHPDRPNDPRYQWAPFYLGDPQ